MAGKKKFLKIVIIAAALIVIIGVAAVSILLANLDSIARKAIVEVMEFVLQVDVELAKVDISVREGGCTLEGLVIGNPKGFKSKEFFSVDRVDVKVDIKSFKSDEPVIHLVSMTNPEITLEQGLTKSNMSVIIKNASRFETEEEEEKKGSEKKIRIDKVIVKAVSYTHLRAHET